MLNSFGLCDLFHGKAEEGPDVAVHRHRGPALGHLKLPCSALQD